ncbi:MAG: Sec-independent protein translocase protein TatB, partial [Pseudomonadota bacterium]
MLDIGWQELLVIGVLALLVVGPKELPQLLRTVGQWAGKARSVAREFQRSMEDAAREADVADFKALKDAKREIESVAKFDYAEQAKRSQSFMNAPAKPEPKADTAAPAPASETPAPAPEAATPAPPPAPAE